MIRVFLIAAGFFSVTIALLVIQPGPDPRAPVMFDEGSDVTRADGDLTDLTQMTAPQPGSEPSASEAADIRRDAMSFGLSDSITDTRSEGTNAIVTQLQQPTSQTTTDATPARAANPDDPLELLVIRALNQGQSEGYIDALVNHAAQTGEVAVPESLITTDGRVDTSALLSALAPQSAPATGPGAGTYVVQPGDTLASIAYRFYGQTSARHQIFDANKDRINASGHLQVGLELDLPAN